MARGWVLLGVLGGCVAAPPGAELPAAREVGPWVELWRVDLPGAEAAHFDPDARRLFVGGTEALWRVPLGGAPAPVAVADRVAGVAVAADGAVFWSEDYDGIAFRWTAAEGPRAWASTWHEGDDDVAGLAFAPPDYRGPLLAPGEAVIVDRGSSGPDEVWAFPTDRPDAERVLHADDGTMREPVDVAVGGGEIVVADTRADSGGRLYRLQEDGRAAQLAIGLADPVGIAWDPLTEGFIVTEAREGQVHRVGLDGRFGLLFERDGFSTDRMANVDVAAAGHLLAITVDDGVVVYGRCEAAGLAPELDCDESGLTDACELLWGALDDCDGDGGPDTCQPGAPGLPDCDCDGRAEGCDAEGEPWCADVDVDGLGDACDPCTDTDGDGFGDPGFLTAACPGGPAPDRCPDVADPDQADADADGLGDACDPCTDTDGDGLGDPGHDPSGCPAGAVDPCPALPGDAADADGDGLGDACDPCTDSDGDGYGDPGHDPSGCAAGAVDPCPAIPGDAADADGDGLGDACDPCTDTDGDGLGDPGHDPSGCAAGAVDPCPALPGDAADADGDGLGDACDPCTDTDGDGYGDPGHDPAGCPIAAVDTCPADPAADQRDTDADGLGDACDPCTDVDGDGYGDPRFRRDGCRGTDCDDLAPGVHPGAPEAPYDGVDQDCDGTDACDLDGDGWAAVACGGRDCDDGDRDVNPGALELPDDGVDQDCDPDNELGCGCAAPVGPAGGPAGAALWLGLAALLRIRAAGGGAARPRG